MNQLASVVIGAVLGAVLAYVFDLRRASREHTQAAKDAAQDRLRRRASIATALLADLQTLEPSLLQLYNRENAGEWKGERPHLFFDALRGEVKEFSSNSVHDVAEFFRRAEDLSGLLAEAATIPKTDEFHHSIRAKAGFALQSIPQAKAALISEGGQVPEPRALEIIRFPDLPTIPPRSFPDVSATPGEELPEEIR